MARPRVAVRTAVHTMDQSEFVALINEHQGIIHKACRLYADREADREDLFQEIVLQLWRAYPSFRGQSKFTTWMYRIALNTAISGFRKRKRRKPELSISEYELQLADAPRDDETEQRLKVMYKAIGKLGKVERAIVLLFLEEHAYKEIGEIVGISENYVAVKMNRIRKKLRTLMEEEETP